MKKSLKNKAVFLDRDGTIVRHLKFPTAARQLRFLPGAAETIAHFNRLGFLVIVTTNQPIISRGLLTPADLEKIHQDLAGRLVKRGARLDAFYFCPHHPDGKIPPWGIVCECRKPEPGLIKQACRDFNIDPKKSFMIGDALIDVLAGQRAGVKTILVKTGPGHPRLDALYQNVEPDHIAANLKESLNFIKN